MFKTKESIIATVVTVLLIVSMGTGLYFFSEKNGAVKMLTGEKLKSEKMLSEKLALSKEIDKLKKDIQAQTGKNGELNKDLKSMKQQLALKEGELKNLNKSISELNSYKKQVADLKKSKELNDKELNDLKSRLAKLQTENNDMLYSVTALQEDNSMLSDKNQVLSKLMANNYGLEAHKKKDKLTVKAKKTKAIVMGFDIPFGMTEKLSFTITNPDGTKVASNNSKTISYAINESIDSNTIVYASAKGFSTPGQHTKRVTLKYNPEEKINGGVYLIEIYADGTYLGTSQIRLI